MPIFKRPRRRINLHALALDAPMPFLPTCTGMSLPWPTGTSGTLRVGGDLPQSGWPSPYDTDEPCPTCLRDVDACTCGIIHPWKRAEQAA